MKKVFLSVALLGVLISSSCTTKSKKQKMNVIYILADDLGYGDLGCYGQKIIKLLISTGLLRKECCSRSIIRVVR